MLAPEILFLSKSTQLKESLSAEMPNRSLSKTKKIKKGSGLYHFVRAEVVVGQGQVDDLRGGALHDGEKVVPDVIRPSRSCSR